MPADGPTPIFSFDNALLLLVLDGGVLAKIGGCVMAGFWLGVAAIMIRRPWTPTRLDLVFVRCGYLPRLIIGVWMASLIAAILE